MRRKLIKNAHITFGCGGLEFASGKSEHFSAEKHCFMLDINLIFFEYKFVNTTFYDGCKVYHRGQTIIINRGGARTKQLARADKWKRGYFFFLSLCIVVDATIKSKSD